MIHGSAGRAYGAFSDSETERILGWLCVIPIGVFQMFIAFVVKKQVGGRLVLGTVLATIASLVVALLATGADLRGPALVTILAIAMLGPGLPTFVSLVRARLLPLGLALFVLPPAPFIFWFGGKV